MKSSLMTRGMSIASRDFHRVAVRLHLVWQGHTYHAVTEAVAEDALTFGMANPPPRGQFVRLVLELPNEGELAIHGVVAYLSPRTASVSERTVGLRFFGVTDEQLAVWSSFIQTALGTAESVDIAKDLWPTGPIDCLDPNLGDDVVVLEYHAHDPADMLRLHRDELVRRGIIIQTALPIASDSSVYLLVTHPSSGDLFGFRCVALKSDRRTVALRFVDVTEQTRDVFLRFANNPDDEAQTRVIDPERVVRSRTRLAPVAQRRGAMRQAN